MSDQPYVTGFLEEIVGVNWGSGPFVILMADVNLQVPPGSAPNPIVQITTPAITVSDSSLPVPDGGVLVPPFQITADDGIISGKPFLQVTSQPYTRAGAPAGVTPVTDAVSARMTAAYASWSGQPLSEQMTPGGGSYPDNTFVNFQNFFVFNLAKIKTTFGFSFTLNTVQPFGMGFAVATYKKVTKVSSLTGFAKATQITTPSGTDTMGPFVTTPPPSLAVSFQRRVRSPGPADHTTWVVTVDPKTLAVNVN